MLEMNVENTLSLESPINQLTDEILKKNYANLLNWPKIGEFEIREILRAGFTYYIENGFDILECYFCHLKLHDWQPEDDPIQAHKDFYPECPYIANVTYRKNNKRNNGPPHHADMCTIRARLETFKDKWPRTIPVFVGELVDAGLFYSGVGDRVICYYCDGQLKDWQAGDNPWMDHAHFHPNCLYVKVVKGEDFIKRAIENRRGPYIDNQTNSITDMASMLTGNCNTCKREKNIVFAPCGHVTCCEECSKHQIKCICGSHISKSVRIYISSLTNNTDYSSKKYGDIKGTSAWCL